MNKKEINKKINSLLNSTSLGGAMVELARWAYVRGANDILKIKPCRAKKFPTEQCHYDGYFNCIVHNAKKAKESPKEKRFREVREHKRLAVGSKKLDKKYDRACKTTRK